MTPRGSRPRSSWIWPGLLRPRIRSSPALTVYDDKSFTALTRPRLGRIEMLKMKPRSAKYALGQVVKHRFYPFRGVIFDVDPTFSTTDEWYNSIPEDVRPSKDQPFYHLFAENADTEYVAYVSEQNLLPDTSGDPIRHPQVDEVFVRDASGVYHAR